MTTRFYSKDHEWIEHEGEFATLGISEYAQEQLGEVVFVELPEVGRTLAPGEESATVESVKAASEVYALVGGEVVAVNEALNDDPSLINRAAEGEGWFYRIKPAQNELPPGLMNAKEYQAFLAQSA